MINAMLSGAVIKDAELKVSAAGKDYLLLIVKHDEILVRVMLFGDDIERLLRVKRGDAVAVVGSLTVGEWQGKPSYSMMAHRALSNVEKRPQREGSPRATAAEPGQFRAAAHAQRSGDGLPDQLPW